MATRKYYIRYHRYEEPFASDSYLGEQFRGTYLFSVPCQLQHITRASFESPLITVNKKNVVKTVLNFPQPIPWGDAFFQGTEYCCIPNSAPSNIGILPGCSVKTLGVIPDVQQTHVLRSDGIYKGVQNSPMYHSFNEETGALEYIYFNEWGRSAFKYCFGLPDDDASFVQILVEWCQHNLHRALVNDMTPFFNEVNIVFSASRNIKYGYWKHFIYPGNDPLADQVIEAEDIDDSINFDDLEDWYL